MLLKTEGAERLQLEACFSNSVRLSRNGGKIGVGGRKVECEHNSKHLLAFNRAFQQSVAAGSIAVERSSILR